MRYDSFAIVPRKRYLRIICYTSITLASKSRVRRRCMQPSNGFVADGPQRLRAHIFEQIRVQVWAAHQDEWAQAAGWQRVLLRQRIERAIDEQYRQAAPDLDLHLLWR